VGVWGWGDGGWNVLTLLFGRRPDWWNVGSLSGRGPDLKYIL
jgi:hypothetical protein